VAVRDTELEIDVEGAGSVSALLHTPDPMAALWVLAHGAGAGMRHASLQAIAECAGARGLGTLRFQFPYMEAGRRRTDRPDVAVAAVVAAVDAARERADGVPLVLGGHSFGGRMASLAASRHALPVAALIFCSFPLHRPGAVERTRATHLPQISQPLLFLSGERDTMADRALLEEVVSQLGPRAELHWLETADHGYRVLKRTRQNAETVFEEIARCAAAFVARVTNPRGAPW